MKPMFTVHEGEFLVGDYINQELGKKYEVWVPTKDTGVDLLVTRKRGRQKQKPVRLQVKLSRGYHPDTLPPEQLAAFGWHALRPSSIRKSTADLWVFAILTLRHKEHYVLIPTEELKSRMPARPGGMWNLYLAVLHSGKCYDMRGLKKVEQQMAVLGGIKDKKRDYSKYLENWKLLDKLSK